MKLKTSELLYTIDEILYDVYEAQVRYVEQTLKNEKQQEVIMIGGVHFGMVERILC